MKTKQIVKLRFQTMDDLLFAEKVARMLHMSMSDFATYSVNKVIGDVMVAYSKAQKEQAAKEEAARASEGANIDGSHNTPITVSDGALAAGPVENDNSAALPNTEDVPADQRGA